MKDFLEQLNDMVAPITRAWKEVEIITVQIDRGGFGVDSDDEMVVDVRLKLSKSKEVVSPIQLSNAKYVRNLYRDLTQKNPEDTKTNAVAGEGPKRGVK